MAKELLTQLRRELKSRLYRDRKEWTPDGLTPVCAICGLPPEHGALEMHETFITRGDVSGNEELTLKIMVKYNCVLIHKKCHIDANSDTGKKTCAENVLYHEGSARVREWLSIMQIYMKSSTPTQAIGLVKEVEDELQSMR